MDHKNIHISVIGGPNTGKSTFIKEAFGFDTNPGENNKTSEIKTYVLEKENDLIKYVTDFPALFSNDKLGIVSTFEYQMEKIQNSDIVVLVLEFNKDFPISKIINSVNPSSHLIILLTHIDQYLESLKMDFLNIIEKENQFDDNSSNESQDNYSDESEDDNSIEKYSNQEMEEIANQKALDGLIEKFSLFCQNYQFNPSNVFLYTPRRCMKYIPQIIKTSKELQVHNPKQIAEHIDKIIQQK